MNQAAIETPETIAFGGLVWEMTPNKGQDDSIEYRTYQPYVGEFRVYKYPSEKGCYSAGKWLWHVKLNGLLHPMPRPSHLDMDCSAIVPTMDDAMQCCLEAKGKFVEQVLMLASIFGVKNRADYEAGFFDGSRVGKEQAINAIRESML